MPRRNIARRADVLPEAAPLVDLLVEERLLSVDTRVARDSKTGEEKQESTIEPTHEALLRQWALLDGWLTEDFGLLATLEGVKRGARDWDANAHGDSWLAHQGQWLTEALALDARPDIAGRLDAIDRAYVAGRRAREETARAEAEQRRREREEEQARKLADARKIAFRTGEAMIRKHYAASILSHSRKKNRKVGELCHSRRTAAVLNFGHTRLSVNTYVPLCVSPTDTMSDAG